MVGARSGDSGYEAHFMSNYFWLTGRDFSTIEAEELPSQPKHCDLRVCTGVLQYNSWYISPTGFFSSVQVFGLFLYLKEKSGLGPSQQRRGASLPHHAHIWCVSILSESEPNIACKIQGNTWRLGSSCVMTTIVITNVRPPWYLVSAMDWAGAAPHITR